MGREKKAVFIDMMDHNEDDVEERNEAVTSRLQQREGVFKSTQFRTGEEAQIREENQDSFTAPFESLRGECEEILSGWNKLPKTALKKTETQLLELVQRMQQLISFHSTTLSAYEMKRAQESIDKLRSELVEKRKSTAPKKFAFKKKTAPAPTTKKTETVKEEEKTPAAVESAPRDEGRSITGLNDVNILIDEHNSIVNPTSLGAKQLEGEFCLGDLTGCTVELLGSLQTLRLSNLRQCTVRCGPTARSVMMDKCVDCTIHVASHQIRIHESHGTTFYLLCRSRPIIEDCTNVQFGCYHPLDYAEAQQDLQRAGLSVEENLWDQIQDFNWLRTDPSPNYSLLT